MRHVKSVIRLLSQQAHDPEATLIRRCPGVMCLLGQAYMFRSSICYFCETGWISFKCRMVLHFCDIYINSSSFHSSYVPCALLIIRSVHILVVLIIREGSINVSDNFHTVFQGRNSLLSYFYRYHMILTW